jgi:hypothetical protein
MLSRNSSPGCSPRSGGETNVRRSPFAVHRSPFTVRRSPFAVRRLPFGVRSWNSVSVSVSASCQPDSRLLNSDFCMLFSSSELPHSASYDSHNIAFSASTSNSDCCYRVHSKSWRMRFGKRGRHKPDDQASNQRNLFRVRSNRNFVPGALKETTWGAGRDPDLILLKKICRCRIPASLKVKA